MANNGDFVLEEGLDEEEDMLSYSQQQQSQQQQSEQLRQEQVPKPQFDKPVTPKTTTTSELPESPIPTVSFESLSTPSLDHKPPPQPQQQEEEQEYEQVTAVIVDGLPITARRKDLDELLVETSQSVTNVRLRRLERHGLLRVRVQFSSTSAAKQALSLDGSQYPSSTSSSSSSTSSSSNSVVYVSIKPSSEERWNASISTSSQPQPQPQPQPQNQHDDIMKAKQAVSNSLWSAFKAARNVAEKLEEKARELGQKFENDFHVSDRMQEADRTYKVTETVAQVAQVGKEVDEQYGISNGVGSVVGGVGDAARIMVREVDENLRVSDKARDVTNKALTSPTVGHVARSVVNSLDGKSNKDDTETQSKKGYNPKRLEFDGEGEGDGEGDGEVGASSSGGDGNEVTQGNSGG